MLVHNECKNAWNQYQQDHKHDLNPETGKKYTRSELAAKYNAEKPAKVVNSNGKKHGNSLDYEGTNYGYILFDTNTNEVRKFGESIHPEKRYLKSYLEEEHVYMNIVKKGSKKEIHDWQHEMILNYKKRHNNHRPDLNYSDY